MSGRPGGVMPIKEIEHVQARTNDSRYAFGLFGVRRVPTVLSAQLHQDLLRVYLSLRSKKLEENVSAP